MKNIKLMLAGTLALAFIFIAGIDSNSYAQGRGGGRPAGAGGGPPAGTGVDRGLGNASTRSNGKSDTGLGRADDNSDGRSTTGIDRARLARANANSLSDNELNRYRGLSRKLGTTPEAMRAAYLAALLANPNLKYGQFVAANVVADNLGGRFPLITSSAILAGLADGDSIGQTLRNLGMTKDQAKVAQRTADDKIKAAKNRNQ
jgi:hypothetical protein